MIERAATAGGHAIVLGGSMAGLLAARVLSEHFERVTVIERDILGMEAENRRGVPQGRHAHALVSGGTEAIKELFPGIDRELIAAGALPADALRHGQWHFDGAPLAKCDSDINGILVSRPTLEAHVRRRVRELSGVEIVEGESARQLLFKGGKVGGVVTEFGPIVSDLVVDATGRGSRTPAWLRALGLPEPEEEQVHVDLTYTTRHFRRYSNDLNGDLFAVISPTPDGKRGGVMIAQEGDKWVVTLFGHFGNRAPGELDEFREYAKTLPSPVIARFLREAEPLDEACVYRFPVSIRRRYEKLSRFPEGFLVFGDAICSFSPAYGQGMSSAALQAIALKDELKVGLADIAPRFFTAAAKVIDNPWKIAVGGDLKMPETDGRRTLGVKFINWYVSRLHKLGHRDPEAATAFVRVAQMRAAPESILTPRLALKVLLNIFGILPVRPQAMRFETEAAPHSQQAV
jgi:2-polyprenyl-6-methoxyphenol hydroxylase-like FAD-dependent oxidoreductase